MRRLDGPHDAVLTIAHGYSWLTAAAFAQRHGLPLHLIVHDDCVATTAVAPGLRHFPEREFHRVYVTAATRFCASAGMEQAYRTMYGVPGTVLHPIRARDSRTWREPPARVRKPPDLFTVAFAGSITAGNIKVLEAVAGWLEGCRGRLEIYGVAAPAGRTWLTSPCISFPGFLPSGELAGVLRERADVLLAPMSFFPADRRNMVMGFPSKLADYTAIGIPILIAGPPDCSAVMWAAANPAAAASVTSLDHQALATALQGIRDDDDRRWELATGALRIGERDFGHAQVQRSFVEALARAS